MASTAGYGFGHTYDAPACMYICRSFSRQLPLHATITASAPSSLRIRVVSLPLSTPPALSRCWSITMRS